MGATEAELRLMASGIPLWGWPYSFESFPELGNPRTAMMAWTDQLNPSPPGIVLYGPPGRGKTGLAISALHQRIEMGQGDAFYWMMYSGADLEIQISRRLEERIVAPCWFETWASLKGRLLKCPLSSREEEVRTARELLRHIDHVASLLVLDDIDQDNLSPWKEEQLLYLIERPLRGKQIILTMNADVSSLIDRLGARIVDRLLDPRHYLVIHAGKGPSFRR